MRQRLIALLAMLALVISVCGVSALAEAPPPVETAEQAEGEEAPAKTTEQAESEEAPAETAEPPEEEETPEAPPVLAGPDLADSIAIEPDPLGQVSFANVERRMRENNLQILTLEQSIRTLEEIDYEDLYEDLRLQLNEIAKAQWALVRGAGTLKNLSQIMPDVEYSDYEYHTAYDQLDRAYAAVREIGRAHV